MLCLVKWCIVIDFEEAQTLPKTSVNIYQSKRHHISEDETFASILIASQTVRTGEEMHRQLTFYSTNFRYDKYLAGLCAMLANIHVCFQIKWFLIIFQFKYLNCSTNSNKTFQYKIKFKLKIFCRDSCRSSDWLRAGLFGDRIPLVARFRTCPDRPWDPPSLLYNRYRVFSRGIKRPGHDADPFQCRGLKTEKSYTSTLPKGLRGLKKCET
jgi:hypothetical protein